MVKLNDALSVCILGISIFAPDALFAETIAGSVFEHGTGKPIVGAQISVIKPSRQNQAEVVASVDTGIDGRFLVDTLPAGAYSVTVLHPEYGAGVERNVKAGSSAAGGDLKFALGRRVR